MKCSHKGRQDSCGTIVLGFQLHWWTALLVYSWAYISAWLQLPSHHGVCLVEKNSMSKSFFFIFTYFLYPFVKKVYTVVLSDLEIDSMSWSPYHDKQFRILHSQVLFQHENYRWLFQVHCRRKQGLHSRHSTPPLLILRMDQNMYSLLAILKKDIFSCKGAR